MKFPDSSTSAVSPASRVLTHDDALALGQKLLEMVSGRSLGVTIDHTARTITQIVNGRALNANDGDTLTIQFSSRFGTGLPVSIGTNLLDDAMLRRVVAQAAAMSPPSPPQKIIEADDPDDPKYFTFNKRDYLPVSLWHDTTIHAMESVRGTVIPQLVEQITASHLVGAATVGFAARSSLYIYKPGLTAFSRETDCEVTVTARTPEGTASGWSGQASRDWGEIVPSLVATQAIEMANRSRNMVALEPGRRVAILGPAAVAQMVRQMAPMFDAYQTFNGHTPFSLSNDGDGKQTKIGMRVVDPRLLMVSDPADVGGGFPPFFEVGGTGLPGFPIPSMTWIDHGILKNLAYRIDGFGSGSVPCEQPLSVRVTTVPGTSTATVDEMIANCREGIYVNRFSDVHLLDMKTGLMTGVTRDGCFFVKNGKIDKPIKNFRFTDSPFFAFNNLQAIGTPVRVAFGYTTPPNSDESLRWPRLPVLVPPMMIQDFNFSSLADAV